MPKSKKAPVKEAAEFNFDEKYAELRALQGAQNQDKDAIRKLQEEIIAAHQAEMKTALAEKDYDKYRHHSDQVKDITRTGEYMKESAWRGVSSAGHSMAKGAETLGKGIVAPLAYMGKGWNRLSTTSKIVAGTIGVAALGIGLGIAFPALALAAPYVVVGAIGLGLLAGVAVAAWKVVSAVCSALKPVAEAIVSVAKATWGVLKAIGRGLISACKFGLNLCRAIKYDVMAEYDRQKPGIDAALERMQERAFKEPVPASVSTRGNLENRQPGKAPEAKPPESKAKPPESKAKPPESKAKPPESKAKPSESKAKPSAAKAKPSESKAKPSAAKAKPPESKAKPSAAKAKPPAAKAPKAAGDPRGKAAATQATPTELKMNEISSESQKLVAERDALDAKIKASGVGTEAETKELEKYDQKLQDLVEEAHKLSEATQTPASTSDQNTVHQQAQEDTVARQQAILDNIKEGQVQASAFPEESQKITPQGEVANFNNPEPAAPIFHTLASSEERQSLLGSNHKDSESWEPPKDPSADFDTAFPQEPANLQPLNDAPDSSKAIAELANGSVEASNYAQEAQQEQSLDAPEEIKPDDGNDVDNEKDNEVEPDSLGAAAP